MYKCTNIDINISDNSPKLNLNHITSKQISIPTFITLNDLQSSNESIASIHLNIKITHSNIFPTPSSFNSINGENTKLSGYKLSIFGIINEVIMFENVKYNMKIFSTTIPFCTGIILPNDTDISNKIHVDVYIENMDIFYIDQENIFQNTYILMSII